MQISRRKLLQGSAVATAATMVVPKLLVTLSKQRYLTDKSEPVQVYQLPDGWLPRWVIDRDLAVQHANEDGTSVQLKTLWPPVIYMRHRTKAEILTLISEYVGVLKRAAHGRDAVVDVNYEILITHWGVQPDLLDSLYYNDGYYYGMYTVSCIPIGKTPPTIELVPLYDPLWIREIPIGNFVGSCAGWPKTSGVYRHNLLPMHGNIPSNA